jgi:organic hydroperoxide reductase OsmC/OhrA
VTDRPAGRDHGYAVTVRWTGDLGQGTADYGGFARDHEITAPGRPPIAGSSDPAFRGDPGRYSPEELLVASLAACHMLWYLHLCADAGIVVTGYVDPAGGTMVETATGDGHFTEVVLRPRVEVRPGSDLGKAERLHELAHRRCFIARSVSFPVRCEPTILEIPSTRAGGADGRE